MPTEPSVLGARCATCRLPLIYVTERSGKEPVCCPTCVDQALDADRAGIALSLTLCAQTTAEAAASVRGPECRSARVALRQAVREMRDLAERVAPDLDRDSP